MAEDPLETALRIQGAYLQERSKFLQDAIDIQCRSLEQAQRNVDKALKAIESYRANLQANDIALEALRAEYRGLLQGGTVKQEQDS